MQSILRHIFRLPPVIRCTLAVLSSIPVAHGQITFASLLEEMTDRTTHTRWPAVEYRSLQASSYHRASKSPDDPNGWFANNDCSHELRKESRDGRDEAVLMEHDGPGVITRIWTPVFQNDFNNRTGTDIRVYIDGETTPRIQGNMISLLTGNGSVRPPFAQTTARAGLMCLPIPFAKSCKITREKSSFFYGINYRAYAPGTLVESFQPEMLTRHAALLEATARELTDPAPAAGTSFHTKADIAPSTQIAGKLPPGPAAVRELEIKLTAANLPVALRSTSIEMRCDGEQTIWCPIGDFFSNINALDPYRTWHREVRADGTMICRWIMPYAKAAEFRFFNHSNAPVNIDVKGIITPWEWTAGSLHFRTNWWSGKPFPARPVFDLNFIEIKGRGIHVGDSIAVLNPLWDWWGEGDEKIYVDEDIERRFPSHFGTGSEDYYGWAGGVTPTRRDEFSSPFAANVRVGGQTRDWPAGKEPHTHGYNICTRARALDATPFARAFKFDMEAYNMIATPDAFLQYTLVSHWYGAPGATHNRDGYAYLAKEPVPQTEDVRAFAKRAQAEGNKPVHIKDAIEMETFGDCTYSPGVTPENQHVGVMYTPHRFSGDGILLLRAYQPGGTATFDFTSQSLPARVIVHPVLSWDFAKLNFYVNDKLALAGWDGYNASAKPGAPIDLGRHDPVDRVIRLKVEIAGKHSASQGCFFGLDAVVLDTSIPAVSPSTGIPARSGNPPEM